MDKSGSVTPSTSLPCTCEEGKEVKKKIASVCDVDPKSDENRAFKQSQKKRNEKRANNKNKKGKKEPKAQYHVRDKTWKDNHCKKLLFNYENPAIAKENIEKAKKELEELQEEFEKEIAEITENIPQKILEEFDKTMKDVERCKKNNDEDTLGFALCATLLRFIGTAETVVGGVEIALKADHYKEYIKKLLKEKDKLGKILKHKEDLKDLEKVKKAATTKEAKAKIIKKEDEIKAKLKKKKDTIYENMEDELKEDDCLKARRCILKKHHPKADKAKRVEIKNKELPMDKIFKFNNKSGCCPGQQSHHIIPEAKISHCAGYGKKQGSFHNNAPTVCVEGGKDTGTHGRIHDRTDDATEEMVYDKDTYKSHHCSKASNSMGCALEASAEGYVRAFPESNCNKDCIKAQLEKYYKKFDECEITPRNKKGDEIRKEDKSTEKDKGL